MWINEDTVVISLSDSELIQTECEPRFVKGSCTVMWINVGLDYALLSVYLSPRSDVCFFPWVDAVLISYQISV